MSKRLWIASARGECRSARPRNCFDYSNAGWPRDFDIRASVEDPAELRFAPTHLRERSAKPPRTRRSQPRR